MLLHSPLRLLIAADQASPTNRALAAALAETGFITGILGGTHLRASRLLGRLDGAVLLGRADVSQQLDGVGSSFWELLRFERAGWPVLNGSRALLRCHDKLKTAICLRRAGLPHPPTVLLRQPWQRPPFRGPYVVKPRFGSWGCDVELCRDAVALEECLWRQRYHRPWFRRQGALVQQWVENPAVDLRVVVAGGEQAGAIERVAAPGEWRTNIALGGHRRPTEASEEAVALARAAAVAVGGDLVGVDLLPGPNGYTVIELNGAVDFNEQYGPGVFARVAGLLAPLARALAAPAPLPSPLRRRTPAGQPSVTPI